MLNLKLISTTGANYFFSGGELYALENNVFCKINLEDNYKPIPIGYGGIVFRLYNGKKLYSVTGTFKIKE